VLAWVVKLGSKSKWRDTGLFKNSLLPKLLVLQQFI